VERHRKIILRAQLEIVGLISSKARTEKATVRRKESGALIVGKRAGGQPPGESQLQAKLAPTKSTKSFAPILKQGPILKRLRNVHGLVAMKIKGIS
jgi:hypothetical protein